MTIKRSMSAQDERPLKRVDKKNRPKKEIDTGKEKGITLETPKTEEQKVSVRKKATVQRHRRRKRILSAYTMHRMQVTAERTERNRQERRRPVHRAPVLQHRQAHQPKLKHLQSQWHRQAHQRQSSL